MKRGDSLIRLRRFRVDEMKRRMATLDGMKADAERKLADLEDSVARERQRAGDSDIGRLAFPSFLRSIESRRENLKATLRDIERERVTAQADLNTAFQELKSLEFANEQQAKRVAEIEARRAQSRLDEMALVRHLRKHGGDIFAWWADFRSRVAFTQPEDHDLVGLLGVAACFSALEDGTPELPFDTASGVIRPDVWRKWLDWDPVRMVPKYADALRSVHSIWIDAGDADNFNLDVGAAAFRAALAETGIPDETIHYEIFSGTHFGIGYRYPLALAWLCKRMG